MVDLLEIERQSRVAYEARVAAELADVEKDLESMPLSTAVDFARELVKDSLGDIKNACFGIVDFEYFRNGRHLTTLKRDEEALVRAKVKHAKRLTVLRSLEGLTNWVGK